MVAKPRRSSAVPKTLGGKIDALRKIRDEKRALAAQVKAVEKRYSEMETLVMEALDASDVRLSEGRTAIASITEEVKPRAEDWDTIHKWIKTNNAQYLYYRQLSAPAFRELLESRHGRKIPGIDAVTIRKLSLRNKAE